MDKPFHFNCRCVIIPIKENEMNFLVDQFPPFQIHYKYGVLCYVGKIEQPFCYMLIANHEFAIFLN